MRPARRCCEAHQQTAQPQTHHGSTGVRLYMQAQVTYAQKAPASLVSCWLFIPAAHWAKQTPSHSHLSAPSPPEPQPALAHMQVHPADVIPQRATASWAFRSHGIQRCSACTPGATKGTVRHETNWQQVQTAFRRKPIQLVHSGAPVRAVQHCAGPRATASLAFWSHAMHYYRACTSSATNGTVCHSRCKQLSGESQSSWCNQGTCASCHSARLAHT